MEIADIKATPLARPPLANIAAMLKRNTDRLGDGNAILERRNGSYEPTSWKTLFGAVQRIAFHLQELGFRKGDRMVLFSRNSLAMLETELAVMASGGIAVPIFAGFKRDTAELLIRHCGAQWLFAGDGEQLGRIGRETGPEHIIAVLPASGTPTHGIVPFNELLRNIAIHRSPLDQGAGPDSVCLNMYTSGTTGVPKCVQLTHGNILSQQAALEMLWKLGPGDRFLSYLPWHHSFGGIFELFTALHSGSPLALESGYGRDAETILENWAKIKPTVFFSVPKVYAQLAGLARNSREAEDLLFRSGLRFVFTAAAPLPPQLCETFVQHGIPVIEGWGLTETSPCCTLTDPAAPREAGLVGKPVPGVAIRIAADGEIQVKGPNVMAGYYGNDEANCNAFTDNGWFRTGDIGELSPEGLRLIARKDRIFKLSNGEKVIPTELEQLIEKKCHYISFALVTGGGREYPVALLFPDRQRLSHPEYDRSPMEGCFCPRSLAELSRCLRGCLHDANCGIGQKFARIRAAAIVDDELTLEKGTLTPSLKAVPENILKAYRACVENMYAGKMPPDQEVYVIELPGTTAAQARVPG